MRHDTDSMHNVACTPAPQLKYSIDKKCPCETARNRTHNVTISVTKLKEHSHEKKFM
jgi:hypothetical protein